MPIQPLWLRTHPTEWNPSEAKVAMNLCLEGGVAEVSEGKARLNFGHVVVLDDFVTEETRIRLFEMICEKGWHNATCFAWILQCLLSSTSHNGFC